MALYYSNPKKEFNKEQFITLVENLRTTVSNIALDSQEICGFFFEDGSTIACINQAEKPQENWLISGSDYFSHYHRAKIKPLGVYHTHVLDSSPDRLTIRDIIPANRTGLHSFVYHTITQKIDYFDPNFVYPFPLNYQEQPTTELGFYLNWEWLWGRSDCLALLRSFYCGYLDISLPDGSRTFDESEFLDSRWTKIQDNYERCGFIELPKSSKLQLYDVLCFSIESISLHHLGIVVKENPLQFLHAISHKKPSSIEVYNHHWQSKLRTIFRHQKFI